MVPILVFGDLIFLDREPYIHCCDIHLTPPSEPCVPFSEEEVSKCDGQGMMIGFLSVFVKIGKGIEDCHNCDRAGSDGGGDGD